MAYGDNRQTVASDTFDSSINGTNWENGGGDWGTFSWVTGGYIQPATANADCALRRSVGTYNADQWAQVVAQVHSGSTNAWMGAAVRMQAGTNESAYIGYSVTTDQIYTIYETDSGMGFTELANSTTNWAALSAGDTLTTEVEGTTIRLGDDRGTDTQRLTTTDATLSSGNPGIQCYTELATSDLRITAWEGGDIAAGGGATDLVTAEAAHAHTADNLALTQAHQLTVAEATHAHAADNATLTQAHALAVAEALHAHEAGNLALAQAHVLALEDAAHGHAADGLTLTQAHVLAMAGALHAHTGEAVSLTQAHMLAVEEALHEHLADNLDLSGAAVLAVEDATHAHTADEATLTQQHLLALADALHAHEAANIPISTSTILAIADALHPHTVEALALTQAHLLSILGALHDHTAGAANLEQLHILVISDAEHAHLAAQVTLFEGGLTPGEERVLILQARHRTLVIVPENLVLALERRHRTLTLH
jgi:hypothetical protein